MRKRSGSQFKVALLIHVSGSLDKRESGQYAHGSQTARRPSKTLRKLACIHKGKHVEGSGIQRHRSRCSEGVDVEVSLGKEVKSRAVTDLVYASPREVETLTLVHRDFT